jgi:hypothetical protein
VNGALADASLLKQGAAGGAGGGDAISKAFAAMNGAAQAATGFIPVHAKGADEGRLAERAPARQRSGSLGVLAVVLAVLALAYWRHRHGAARGARYSKVAHRDE